MIDWVDKELECWGEFMKGGVGVNLGFSRESLEYRMMTFGPDSMIKDSKCASSPDPYVPDRVARAECILLDKYITPVEFLTMARVVYTMPSLTRESQAEIITDRLGFPVSRRKLLEMLGNLHHRYDAHVNSVDRYAKKDLLLVKKDVDSVPPKSV